MTAAIVILGKDFITSSGQKDNIFFQKILDLIHKYFKI